MTLGSKLKEFGIAKFGSVNAFAEALGILPNALSRYIHDKSEPGAKLLKRIKTLGCNIDWLLAEENNSDDISPPETIVALKAKNDQLEEENRLLRDKLGQITVLTQVVEIKKKGQQKDLKGRN